MQMNIFSFLMKSIIKNGEYEMENEQVYEMKFYAINDGIVNGISGQFKKRNLLPPNEGLDQYINSLFNVNNNKEDGTEVSKA